MQNKITNKNISQESMFPSTDIRLKQYGNCGQKQKFPIQPPEGKKEVNNSVLYLVKILILHFRFQACPRMVPFQKVDKMDQESLPLGIRLG